MQGAFKIRNEPAAMKAMTPTEGIYVIQANNTPEPISTSTTAFFQKLWLYPAKAVAGGVLTANANSIRLGLSSTYLRDLRAATDTDYPVIIELPLGQRMALSQVYIYGTASDGVFFSYV